MNRFSLLLAALVATLALGCGDDSPAMDSSVPDATADATADAAPDGSTGSCMPSVGTGTANCPELAPDFAELMGSCCWRSSNATQLDTATFRIAALKIEEPASLANTIVGQALNSALDEERFNWLISISGAAADGSIEVTTGFGERNADNTFSYLSGTAPAPGDVNRWDAVTTAADLEGECFSAAPIANAFTVPILEDDGVAVVLELPLQAFELVNMSMNEDRSCVGVRRPASYSTDDAEINTYITIADAMNGQVELPPISTSLCNFIAGMTSETLPCNDPSLPQADWPVPPNAVCTAGACSDTCDVATECNAWRIRGGFAAHGIAIN